MLKVGVIGLGSISEFHLNAYQKNPKVQLMAICDLNEKRLEEKGDYYQVDLRYTNYQELLANKEVDAISICTWNNTHAEIAIAALQAGKHVLIEKPISINTEQALQVENAAKASNKTVQIGFVRRFGSNTQILKKFIDNHDLGNIYYAKASVIRRLGNPGGWFSDSKRSGGGPLIDLGVHIVDLCWYLMGKPKPVSVTGNTYSLLGNRSHIENLSFYKAADYDPGLNDVEDLANAMIVFENGASLLIDVSFTLHAKEDELSVKIYGEKGGAEVEPELLLVTEKHDTILNMQPQIDFKGFDFDHAFDKEVNHFVECCITGNKTIAPVEDGVEVLRMLSAIYQSANIGKEVRFDYGEE
ncbi:Gfo/Idh/MocA family protein [Bacillus testis]|uniref:Gfo/Idh/MocA family protein n=1 Tax=Bacillus testis TaxID=1622072 RepID=UPI00067EFB3A|nr:Gfo/Idh/MocA family oxidoreductase [Bacillus testis]